MDTNGDKHSDEEDMNEEELIEVIDLEGDENDEENLIDTLDDMLLEDEEIDSEPIVDNSALVFSKHEGPVFCVSTNSDSTLAISGGQDDVAYVWNIATGDVCFKCAGHRDSVIAVAFNRNDRYVCSADMAGLVQVWNTENGSLAWSAECSDLEWLLWHHLTDALLAGTSEGTIWMWLVPIGSCKVYQGPGCASSCGKLTPDGKFVASGFGDGSLRVWDLKSSNVVYCSSGAELHRGSITNLDVHFDNNLVITSSADATAKLYSYQNKKYLSTYDCSPPGSKKKTPKTATTDTDTDTATAEPSSMEDSDNTETEIEEKPTDGLECVRFSPTHPYLATAGLTGTLTIWDLGTGLARCSFKHEAGIVSCIWDKLDAIIYTCTLDGLVYKWNARTGDKIKTWSGHEAPILDMEVSKDGRRIVTSSDDGTVRIFNVNDVGDQ